MARPDSDERLRRGLKAAIRTYWQVRGHQNDQQGQASGRRDTGNRAAVTGGAQLSGLVELFRSLLLDCGLSDAEIYLRRTTLPGFFRPTKNWDLVVVADGTLLATIEVKSHAGPSFGNNFNNRVEEALGSATDFWAAYAAGAFRPSARPFLGYLMVLEAAPKSTSAVRERSVPIFPALPEFNQTSYQDRYRLFCRKLLTERLYDASCLITTDRVGGLRGDYAEPDPELSFRNFVLGLTSRAIALNRQR